MFFTVTYQKEPSVILAYFWELVHGEMQNIFFVPLYSYKTFNALISFKVFLCER